MTAYGDYVKCAYCGALCDGGVCSSVCAQQLQWEMDHEDEDQAGLDEAYDEDDEPRVYEGDDDVAE